MATTCTSMTRRSSRLKEKEEQAQERRASFRQLRTGNTSTGEINSSISGTDSGETSSEESELQAPALYPTPTRLNDPANNFTRVYNSYCQDKRSRSSVLDCYEREFIDDSEFHRTPSRKRNNSVRERKSSQDLTGVEKQRRPSRRLLEGSSDDESESSSITDSTVQNRKRRSFGTATSERARSRRHARIAGMGSSDEDGPLLTPPSSSVPMKRKPGSRSIGRVLRTPSSSGSDLDSSGVVHAQSKRSHVSVKDESVEHSSSDDNGVDYTEDKGQRQSTESVDTLKSDRDKEIETPTRAASSRAKIMEQRRKRDHMKRLEQLKLHRARQQGNTSPEDQYVVINSSSGTSDSDCGAGKEEDTTDEDIDNFIVDDSPFSDIASNSD